MKEWTLWLKTLEAENRDKWNNVKKHYECGFYYKNVHIKTIVSILSFQSNQNNFGNHFVRVNGSNTTSKNNYYDLKCTIGEIRINETMIA